MRRIFIFLLLLSFHIGGVGQVTDSLHQVIKTTSSDSIKASCYHQLSSIYNNHNQLDSALYYHQLSLAISTTNQLEEIIFYNKEVLAIIYAKKSEYQSADSLLLNLEKDILNAQLSDSIKKPHLLSVYITLGIINTINNHNSKALEFYLKGVKQAKAINKTGALATLYNNIGNIYISEEDDDLAREYLLKAKQIYLQREDYKGLTKVHHNLGNIHRYHKAFQLAINQYENAKKYATLNHDSISIANENGKIGQTYLELYENYNDSVVVNSNELNLLSKASLLNKALNNYLEAKNSLIKRNMPVNKIDNKIGKIYLYQGKYQQAIQLFNKNYDTFDLYAINDKIEAIEGLKKGYKALNNFQSALKWNEELAILNDTLKERENLKEFGKKQAELSYIKTQEIDELKHQTEIEQINHENEKKELIAQNKQRQQRYIIWSIALGLVLIGVFLIIVIKRWSVTKAQKETINAQKLIIEKEKLATEDSINYARNIQKAAFPSLTEVKNVIPNNFILFNPKDIVSGDFYWANQIGNKKFVALADCTGHGVPGAFMTLISLNILNQIIADGIDTPIAILEQLHLRLQKRLNNKDGNASKHGLDLAICLVEDQKVTYAGVHIPIYHVRNGSLTEYKGQKFQLGSNGETLFQQYEILTQPGDTFYISTDGFPDQKGGPKGKKYFYPTLRKKLLNIVHLELEEQRQDLNDEFINWKGQQEQLDDVSILGFKI